MTFATTDLYDAHGDELQVVDPILKSIGGRARFSGEIATVKCHEDNSRVKERLATPGGGKVLVVDGGGSLRCALLGDMIADDAVRNGWEGVIVFGAVRDSEALSRLDLGVWALACTPRKSVRRGEGQADLMVAFGGVRFVPGQFVYVDRDGILVASRRLLNH